MAAVLVLVAASGFVAPLRCIPLRSKPVCCEPPQPPQSPQELSKATPPVEPAKTYSSGWSGEGRFADEDALPLSFWIFGNSPRRAVIAGLTSAVIGPAVNLWGSGSFLLSLAPDVSREQKLDTFYPVSNKFLYPYNNGYLDYIDGYKRYVDQSPVPRYEFRYPATYVQDQSVFLRNADRAYAQRVADPQNVMGGGRPRSSGGPEVAFGPPDTRGEENLSIVTGSLPAGFSLRDTFGTAADGAERLIQAQIAKPGLREATLLSASERKSARSGKLLYQFEYRVEYPGLAGKEPTYTVCVVGAAANTLFTFASRVPEAVWKERQDVYREAASSFVLL